VRRRSLLRRGSPAGDLRAVTVRWGRIRDTTRRGEDNAEQRGHGGALISSGHGELALRRGAGHGGVAELAIGLSPSHGHNCGELERVEQCGTLLCARAISPGGPAEGLRDGEQWRSGSSAATALRLSGVGEGGGNKSEWRGRRMRLQVENIGSGFRPATARGLGGQSAVDARRHAAVDF